MKSLRLIWIITCCLPVVLLGIAPMFPQGIDSRGYGPRLVASLVAVLISFIVGLVGAAALIMAKRLQIRRHWIAGTTLFALAPAIIFVVTILRGKP